MQVHERLSASQNGRSLEAGARSDGWRTSGRSGGLGLGAWVLAVVVVAVFAVGLHLLYE